MSLSSTLQMPPLIILCGGEGTRLGQISLTCPKPMQEVLGRPFLHWLVKHYASQGITEFYFATRYLSEKISEYNWGKCFPNLTFYFFADSGLIGTGGAVQQIFRDSLRIDCAWIVNGDTYIPECLPECDPNRPLMTAISSEEIFEAAPNLDLENSYVKGFGSAGAFLDAGAIFLPRKMVVGLYLKTPFSMSRLAEEVSESEVIKCHIFSKTVYDIGTPTRLERFKRFASANFMEVDDNN